MQVDKGLDVIVTIPIVGVEERDEVDAKSDRVIAPDKPWSGADIGVRFWQTDMIDGPIVDDRIWYAVGDHDMEARVSLLGNTLPTMMQHLDGLFIIWGNDRDTEHGIHSILLRLSLQHGLLSV